MRTLRQLLRRPSSKDPAEPLRRARAYIKEERWADASALLDDLKQRQERLPDLDYLRAKCFKKAKNVAAAIEAAQQELRNYPENSKAKEFLGKLLAPKTAPRRVFQIGFNKCASTSFYLFFKQSGYQSIHWDEGRLARRIQANAEAGLPLLTGYESYSFFSDMECLTSEFYLPIYSTHFQQLDREYPGSRFILNTRDREKWISSRLRHGLLDRFMQAYNQSREQIIETWRADWERQHAAVQAYFAQRPESLLIYDIDKDGVDKIREFLPEFELVGSELPHANKTNRPS